MAWIYEIWEKNWYMFSIQYLIFLMLKLFEVSGTKLIKYRIRMKFISRSIQGKPLALSLCSLTAKIFLK